LFSIYPEAIDGYSQLPLAIDTITKFNADSLNRLRAAIINIENELGVLPKGSCLNVSERLNNFEKDILSLTEQVSILTKKIERIENILEIKDDHEE